MPRFFKVSHFAQRLLAPWLAVAVLLFAVVPLVQAGPSGSNKSLLAEPDESNGQPVTVSSAISRSQVQPGSRFLIQITFDHAPGWHVHTNDPKPPKSWDFVAIPTTVEVPAIDGVHLARIQWPATQSVLADLGATGKPEAYAVFGGKAVVFLPFVVDKDAKPGVREITIPVGFQACNETTCQGPVDLKLKFKITVGDKAIDAADQTVFAGFDPVNFESTTRKTIHISFFGKDLEFDPSGSLGFLLLLLAALLGGFLLNLTPCVLPVIPIKMMGLSHAAGTRSRTFFLGVMMSLGVIAFWTAIGAAISLIKGFSAVNQLFQQPLFSIGIGLFIGFMAIGMFGAFTLNLPQWVYAVDPKRNTVGGSIVFGVMTAVLSTPCTAPFGGAAMAWAATQDIWITLTTFATIGLGMAIPYLLLAAFPQLVKNVPKTGPASELLKQVLGLLMLAVAIFFIGVGLDPKLRTAVDPPIRFHWWIIALVIVGGMGWMIYRLNALKVRIVPRMLLSVAGLLVAVGMVIVAKSVTDRGPINWVGFTPDRYAQAVKEKKIIVTDFTAEWCLNCKTLEAAVLHKPEIVAALNDPAVAAFRVDLTGDNPAGQDRLKALKWIGIPLLSIEGPGAAEPVKFDTYTPQVVLDSMAKAGYKASKTPSVK